ncbi:hypothetical protein TNCV_1828411 [Trichonephila clavipes]|nr:hypothetical protein TNCV_1828411 [Trichonephila clavipes]
MRGGKPLTLPQGALYQNWGGSELNRTVACMVLKATATTGVHLAPCHDEFRGPRSDYVRQEESTALPKKKGMHTKEEISDSAETQVISYTDGSSDFDSDKLGTGIYSQNTT